MGLKKPHIVQYRIKRCSGEKVYFFINFLQIV